MVSWSPSSTESSTPVTVTVWGVDQLATVNVSVDGDTVASPVSPEATDSTTSLVGGTSKATVNVSVEPPSVTDAVVFDRVNAAGSAADRNWTKAQSVSLPDLVDPANRTLPLAAIPMARALSVRPEPSEALLKSWVVMPSELNVVSSTPADV